MWQRTVQDAFGWSCILTTDRAACPVTVTTKKCTVCDAETRTGVDYTAQSDDSRMLVSLPSIECTVCGAIGLDRERVSTMPPESLPAAIRGRDTAPPADSSANTERPAPSSSGSPDGCMPRT